jgi:hypothetical protein
MGIEISFPVFSGAKERKPNRAPGDDDAVKAHAVPRSRDSSVKALNGDEDFGQLPTEEDADAVPVKRETSDDLAPANMNKEKQFVITSDQEPMTSERREAEGRQSQGEDSEASPDTKESSPQDLASVISGDELVATLGEEPMTPEGLAADDKQLAREEEPKALQHYTSDDPASASLSGEEHATKSDHDPVTSEGLDCVVVEDRAVLEFCAAPGK